MPSSLIIVALAGAWLVVLVPMVARKRQEVARTAGDAAMTSRVLSRREPDVDEREENPMPEQDTEREQAVAAESEPIDEDARIDDAEYEAEFDEDTVAERARRRYRPGRGGFDPEAAELAAKAKYQVRQRVVLGLMITVVITALLAAVVSPAIWWVCGAAAVCLVGYLAYLRRQVSIEAQIRRRRMQRLSGRHPEPGPEHSDDAEYDDYVDYPDEDSGAVSDVDEPEPASMEPVRGQLPPRQQRGVVVDLDDEDPSFYELGGRAVGE